MSYGRLSKPCFYMDNFNWQASRGLNRNTALTIKSAALNTGYTKYQMFDMDPVNYASWNVGGGGTKISILIDLGIAGIKTDSITIMNHDLGTQGGNIRVAASSATMSAGGGTTVTNLTEVLNGTVSGSYPSTVAAPVNDGDTLLTFDSVSLRYILVEFDDVAAGWNADVKIGAIVLSKKYTMPISPDMPVSKSTAYEGVRVRKSYSGKAFGSASWILANTGDYTAFRYGTEELKVGGRETFDFSIGFMDDSNIYASDRATPRASDNFLADVVVKSAMNLIPFIFAIDSASSVEGDFLYSRFDADTFASIRKAWKVESFSLRLIQEF